MSLAALDELITGDSPVAYYICDQAEEPEDGEVADTGGSSGAPLKIVNGVWGENGPKESRALFFDGESSYGVTEAGKGLSGKFDASIEMLINWNAYNNEDALACELGTNANGIAGLRINPDSSDGSDGWTTTITSPGSVWEDSFPRPFGGLWRHHVYNFDRGAPGLRAWQQFEEVEGAPVIHTPNSYGTFDSASLYLMSRGGTELFASGTISRFAIYARSLTDEDIQAREEAYFASGGGGAVTSDGDSLMATAINNGRIRL